MQNKVLFGALLAALAYAASAPAEEPTMHVIDMHYRDPRQMVPLLAPLVSPDGSVSAFDNKLVVRATAAQMSQVQALLDSVDKAPRQLLIYVRQGSATQASVEGGNISGGVRRADGSIVIGRQDDNAGRTANGVAIQVESRSRQGESDFSQQVRAEEGRESSISLGQYVPPAVQYRMADGGSAMQRTVTQSVGGGFSVLPRIQGGDVQLEISYKQQVPQPDGTVAVQRGSTSVRGPIGSWFDIGGAVSMLSQNDDSLLSGSSASVADRHTIMVKVVEVKSD